MFVVIGIKCHILSLIKFDFFFIVHHFEVLCCFPRKRQQKSVQRLVNQWWTFGVKSFIDGLAAKVTKFESWDGTVQAFGRFLLIWAAPGRCFWDLCKYCGWVLNKKDPSVARVNHCKELPCPEKKKKQMLKKLYLPNIFVSVVVANVLQCHVITLLLLLVDETMMNSNGFMRLICWILHRHHKISCPYKAVVCFWCICNVEGKYSNENIPCHQNMYKC